MINQLNLLRYTRMQTFSIDREKKEQEKENSTTNTNNVQRQSKISTVMLLQLHSAVRSLERETNFCRGSLNLLFAL